MNQDKTFGETIKKLREERQMPLREVADALGIDTSMLGKIEKNNRRPSKTLLDKMATFFDVSERELTIAYLSDAVVYQVLEDEDFAAEVLKVAEEKVQYIINRKSVTI
jgi:transcriptional regulator with XRE-family HTH domain